MQLRSPDGALVALRIAGYQFPDYRWAHDEDANWLQIRGSITLANGKTWAFEDPCLRTWDARELGSWLSEVAAGVVPPSPVTGGEPEGLLYFLEPNVAFSVEERTAARVWIRVHFSLESLPLWLQGPEEPGLFEYFVRLDVSAEELNRAAASWMLELAEFPER